MANAISLANVLPLDSGADLQTVLAAWHTATLQLEHTHEALREEVRRLTDELEVKNRELARKNRLADLGRMASHVAHEVRNNLVPVTLYMSLLRRRLSDDHDNLEILAKVEAGFTAMDATVRDLLHFTSDRDPQIERFSLSALVRQTVDSLAPQLAAQSIDTVVDISSGQMIAADQEMLRRALLNLMLNALDVMTNGGTLSIRSRVGDEGVEVEVADTGPGLSEDAQRRAFEPFFTTKSSGTGLGLAIVCRIADVHGGRAVATNGPDGGAVFTLCLPQSAASTEAAA